MSAGEFGCYFLMVAIILIYGAFAWALWDKKERKKWSYWKPIK